MTRTVDRQSIDTQSMRSALRAALAGPAADPNPRVGALVVDRDGAPVGVGHHAGAGTPHAEIVALRRAGERAAGGTLYVTLEPCSHTGRTPPCVDAVVDAGVVRVVYGTPDPNPEAAGGAAVLAARGVQVDGGPAAVGAELAGATQDLVRAWAFAMHHGRPFVVWKAACTLDGRVAALDGSSAWITSAAARADAHALRSRSGAVVVGAGTALLDDPALTARRDDGSLLDRQPLRVVVGHRPLPAGARLADGTAPTLQLRTHDPREALAELHGRGVRQVLLEGGPTLSAAFWRAGLVDEVVTYLAPALLGAGVTAVQDLGITSIDGIARLEVTGLERVGPDIRITSRPVAGEKR